MTIRFLMTTASQSPAYPFQAGQVIHLSSLTPDLKRWITEGRAELVREEAAETAMIDIHVDRPARSTRKRAIA